MKRRWKLPKAYPQLPVLSQDGTYHIADDEKQVIETGTNTTTIVMCPDSKSKRSGSRKKGASKSGRITFFGAVHVVIGMKL